MYGKTEWAKYAEKRRKGFKKIYNYASPFSESKLK
jgi:hypothetical protein